MPERIIVSLTTWSARVDNVPAVLDTIFAQTLPPDLVVLNVAYDLEIPQTVQDYLDQHHVEIYRCPDTKVYKKLIHTLKRYPDDCVISIDDDWLYPEGMIEDFVDVHKKYPDYPISGNKVVFCGMQCHCGCASLTKAEYFGDYLCKIDGDVIDNCPSDDLVYTYFAYKNGHPYMRSCYEYFVNMESFNASESYTYNHDVVSSLDKTYRYLVEKYGMLDISTSQYIRDNNLSQLLDDIVINRIADCCSLATSNAEKKIRNTISYRIGRFFTFPFSRMRSLFQK